ncbi:hypothetical protein Tco_0698927 [Tanacetum coccineum]
MHTVSGAIFFLSAAGYFAPDPFPLFRSCMNHWKNGFFFIDRRAIPDYMSWRLLNSAIDDPKPLADSYNWEDVRRLSVHFVNLQDIPEGVLVLSGLSRVWKSQTCDLVLRGADGNVMGIHDFLCLFEWIGVEDLTVGTLSAKVLAKADSLKKRKALLSEAASSHNQSGGSAPSATKGPNARDDRGKAIMTDAAVAPTRTVGRSRSGDASAASFRDVSGDAIHRDFFPFSPGPYYATYSEGGIAGNFMDQFPTPGEMVQIKALTDDQLNAKMSDLHYLMMSHGGIYWPGKEQKKKIKFLTKNLDQLNADVTRLTSALNQATVVKVEQDAEILRLKASPLELVSFFVVVFKAWFGSFFLVTNLAELKLSSFLWLPVLVLSLGLGCIGLQKTNVPAPKDTRTSPHVMKDSTVVPVSSSLELPSKADPSFSAAVPEQNEE